MRMNECKTPIIYFTVCNRSFRQRPVRQRMKSIRQRRMSVRRRLYKFLVYASHFGTQCPKYFFVCLGSG